MASNGPHVSCDAAGKAIENQLIKQAENSYFDGKLALLDAFDQFKSDLFMSSLTESSGFTVEAMDRTDRQP